MYIYNEPSSAPRQLSRNDSFPVPACELILMYVFKTRLAASSMK